MYIIATLKKKEKKKLQGELYYHSVTCKLGMSNKMIHVLEKSFAFVDAREMRK